MKNGILRTKFALSPKITKTAGQKQFFLSSDYLIPLVSCVLRKRETFWISLSHGHSLLFFTKSV